MASGTINLTSDISTLKGKIEWSSTSNGTAANSSKVTATLYIARTDSYETYGTWTFGFNVGGTTAFEGKSASVSSSWVAVKTLVNNSVPHNPDGTGTCFIEAYCNGPEGTSMEGHGVSGSQTVTLDRIPRYTSITSFSVAKRNETSVTYNFTTADTCDYAWYSTNNGSSWTGVDITDGTSASFVVSGLSPNTTYNFKVRVRRKDSQLTTDSGTVQQTTYKAPTQSLNSKTETTITMNWSVDTTADYIWYSTNNGSSWVAVGAVNATSGSYTISGLSANTSYNIKTRVRRKAPQTTYDTSASSQATYNYPYVSAVSTSALVIGNSQTLTLYNPLSRNVTIKMNQNNVSGTELYSGTTSGTSITFTPTANTLYASIPNSTSGNCVYSVVYGNITKTTSTYTYKITGNEIPTFNDFTYEDTNSTTTALTGDNQILINGYSNVTATISVANKAVANNSASMNNYVLSIGNQSAQANYSSSADVTMSIQKVTNETIKVTANDSRGLSKSVQKTATIKNYIKPATTTLTATRSNNGVGEDVTLAFEGTWWNDSFGLQSNAIQTIQYYFRKSTTNTWTTGTTTITFTTNQNRFSGSLLVEGDTQSHGFDATSSYYIKIIVTDKLDNSEEYQVTIGSGTPAVAIYKDNIAIGQQYNTTTGGKVQVNGDIIQSGQPQNTQFSGHFFHSYYPNSSQVYEHFYPQSQHGTQSTTTSTANLRVWDGTNKNFRPFTISGDGSVSWGGYINSNFRIPKDGTAGKGLANASGSSIIRDHNNGNITVDATGGNLYLGYQNTTGINIMNGKATIDANGFYSGAVNQANCIRRTTTFNSTGQGILQYTDGEKLNTSASNNGWAAPNNGWWQILHMPLSVTGFYNDLLFEVNGAHLAYRQRRSNTYSGWEYIFKGKNLYSNASGTTGTVTLNESAANFEFLEIFYGKSAAIDSVVKYNSLRIFNPNGKSANLSLYYRATSSIIQFIGADISISGTSITKKYYHNENFNTNGTINGGGASDNSIVIYKVDAYR